MSDITKAIARKWFEQVWNERREEVIDELLTSSSVCHTDDGPIVGPGDFRDKLYRPFLAAFPDIRVTVEEILAEGESAVVRWSARGTHSGEGIGIAVTGKPATFHGMTWIQLEEGKFKTGWQYSSIPQVLRALPE